MRRPKLRSDFPETWRTLIMPHSSGAPSARETMPPVLSRMWRGTLWLALKAILQVIIAFWSVPLVQHAIGSEANGAYVFAWGFGFIQFLLEFGMGAALQRQVTYAWTNGDHDEVKKLIACGTTFYLVMSVIQSIILLTIAYLGLPSKFQGEPQRLIIGLLWIQALSAPFFGLLTVVASVLQAARRYEFLPRLDLAILIIRFGILVVGLRMGVEFLLIVGLQTFVLVGGALIPALWVMVRELDCVPHLTAPRRADYAPLFRIGAYIFLMQLSVVLADKVDTTILGYALRVADPGHSITVYQNVSKPFFQIRQTSWTLAYLVVPAVASLAASRDTAGLERLKYDGTRFLVGLLLPVTLLAGIYAAPFLSLWVGPRYASDASLLQLFLVAALPMVLSVPAQMAIGLGKFEVIAFSSLFGSLINLPISYYLTTRLGVAGVIWGTVLTTLISNLLVPAVYLFRTLEIQPRIFLRRTLGTPLAGAALLLLVSCICRAVVPAESVGTSVLSRSSALLLNLFVSSLAYLSGYIATPVGRSDLVALVRPLRRQQLPGG
jgi:O-antigen/teichoic acid export membrane protein